MLAQLPVDARSVARHARVRARPVGVIASGLVANIPSLVFLVVLFFVFRMTLRLIRLFFGAVESGAVRFELRSGMGAADLQAGPHRHRRVRHDHRLSIHSRVEFGGIQGVSLFIGIVFSLGSTSAIANLIAGYMLTYRRAFKVGDRIKVGDAFGEVIETRLQVTHIGQSRTRR